MDYRQYRRTRKLVHACCNYDNGNCIMLEDGEECVCVQSISYSLLCRWFRIAVLPLDNPLETALLYRESMKRCAVCDQPFLPRSNRAKYCKTCAAKVHRKQKNVSNHKKRLCSPNMRRNTVSETLSSLWTMAFQERVFKDPQNDIPLQKPELSASTEKPA